MKIKIFIVAITVVVLTALSAAGFFVYKNLNRPVGPIELSNIPSGEGSENPPTGGEEVLKETRLIKDDFEITLPLGWQEATSTYEGFLLLAFDAKEDISGGNFQKFDFRTNLSIKSDNLGKYSTLDTLEKYVESMKISLTQAISGITFIKEEQKTINNSQGILIECSSRQEEADFKTLLVFVKGNDNIIYAISFNTFQGFWPVYRDLFYQTAESFKLRYNI